MSEHHIWALVWRILRLIIAEIERGDRSPFTTDLRRGLLLIAGAIEKHKIEAGALVEDG